MNEQQFQKVLDFQKDEITGYLLYRKLAGRIKDAGNAKILHEMAEAENSHYQFWKEISGKEVRADCAKIFFYTLMFRLLGLTFSVKLMEKGEKAGVKEYEAFEAIVPGSAKLGHDEQEHEDALAAMIHEDFLSYIGSIVLGLNDAMVELTGTLAGLTFALQNGKLVAASGLITGIAAAFSMAASQYLSERAESNAKAGRSALYTGAAYLITVILLILPYLLVPQTRSGIFISLAITLLITIAIIFGFNFFVSVAKDQPFKPRFIEMLVISMGVAVFSFLVGLIVRNVFGVDV